MRSASSPPLVVAVIEDDASARTALGRLLRASGFEPALFESAEAFIDASPPSLCAIVDVQLPGMSGIELQQRLRAAGKHDSDHRDDRQLRPCCPEARAGE